MGSTCRGVIESDGSCLTELLFGAVGDCRHCTIRMHDARKLAVKAGRTLIAIHITDLMAVGRNDPRHDPTTRNLKIVVVNCCFALVSISNRFDLPPPIGGLSQFFRLPIVIPIGQCIAIVVTIGRLYQPTTILGRLAGGRVCRLKLEHLEFHGLSRVCRKDNPFPLRKIGSRITAL